MTNIVVPMAGAGKRFADAGYTVPKPFIEVFGRPMIELVLENLATSDSRFILITRQEHQAPYQDVFSRIQATYNAAIIVSDGLTEGPVCSVFLAVHEINNNEPLLIANSDQLVDIALAEYLGDSDRRQLDGSILTFYSDDPKWSFAATDAAGIVTHTKEKVAISSHATVGLYYFAHGRDFVSGAAEMIGRRDRTNNEFYVAPVYNYLIARGKRYGIYEITEEQMHGLGTPADLTAYLQSHTREAVGSRV